MTGGWPALFASVHNDLALDVSVPRRLNAFVAVVFFSALREGTDGFLSALRAMVVAVPLSAAKVAEHNLVASQTKYTKAAASRASVVQDTPLLLRDAPGRLGHSSPFCQRTVCGPIELDRKKSLDGAVELSPEKW